MTNITATTEKSSNQRNSDNSQAPFSPLTLSLSLRVLRLRKIKNSLAWIIFGLFLALILAPLLWLVFNVVYNSLSDWQFSVLFTPTEGNGGGIANAIVGTVYIIIGVGILAGLVGVGTGIYLSEFAGSRFKKIVGTCADILSGVPSILFGFVGYNFLVLKLNWGFSASAAIIVLSIMVVPYIAKSTETALSKIPTSYREASGALGMNKTQTVFKVVVKPAIPMILNGLIIAIAIAIGETAPMLYTAGWLDGYPKLALTHSQLPYLTYLVWTDYNQPFKSAKILSNDAAFVILIIVGFLFVATKVIGRFAKTFS